MWNNSEGWWEYNDTWFEVNLNQTVPMTNFTKPMNFQLNSTRNIFIILVYMVLFVIAAVGNLTVFISLFRSRHRKSRISLMIRHLTIADLIVTFVMIPIEGIPCSKMSKDTFNALLIILDPQTIQKRYHGGEIPVSPKKALLMFLWWVGKGEVLNSIADRFNVAPSTVYNYTELILDRFVELLPRYIHWPNERELVDIEVQFRQICGYPGVIGVIDGCNIHLKAPTLQQESYIDKNDRHSVKIQVIATASRILTNVNIGFPGSVHDSRMFSNSSLYKDIVNNGNLNHYFPLEAYHLLGDKAYPLLPWLITPYRQHIRMNRREQLHNLYHSRTRIKIEHTLGLLIGRWRILKYINVNEVEKATKVIVSCCVLHNFCYIHSDDWIEQNEDLNFHGDEDELIVINNNVNMGLQKRDEISQLFV